MNQEDLQLIPRTRATDLLGWAAEQGREPVSEGALRTVLTLLELSGARLHDGYPELTSALLEELLYQRLHLYVQPSAEDPLEYGRAVALLIDHQRASRRLNAKRQERLHQEAEWQGELLCGLLRRPDLLTWPRLYALLLAEHGVDAADPVAVRTWLDAFRELPPEQRAEAYHALTALEVPADDEGWTDARTLSVGMATDGARRLLEYGLIQRSYRNLAELTARGLPMPAELAGDVEQFEAVVAREALRLCGEWTVPGLPALLLEEYPDLAPEPGPGDVEAFMAERQA